MPGLERVPAGARRFARRVLPASFVDAVRGYIVRWYLAPGNVSRQGPVRRRFRRWVLRRPPVLHRVIVHVTDHCNLNCKGCTHFSNIASPAFADPERFEDEMRRLSGVFPVITEIFLLGGEPLLHPDVESFVTTARRLFPASRINLMSNGVLVTRMPESFWHTMHDADAWLVLDLYPIGLPVAQIEDLASSHGVKLEWTDPRAEFFKLPLDLEGKQDPADSFERCRGANNCVVLRDGRLYPCAYAAYVDLFEKRFGVEGLEPSIDDWVPVDDPRGAWGIMDFLLKPVPWCRFCDFGAMETYSWARSTRSIDEWTSPTGVPVGGPSREEPES